MNPEWVSIAIKELGIKELKDGDNSRIVEYADTTSLHAKQDEVPWCSSFVNWCLKQAGIKGTNSAAAISWLDWGVSIDEPIDGCICVIKRKEGGKDKATGSSSGYHVAFWISQDKESVHLLGGNQSDQVKISSFMLRSYEIAGYRMPTKEDYI